MKKFLLYITIFGIACWMAGFLAFNYNINNYKIDMQTKTDAIVALTGGKNRIAEAAQMMDKGLAKKMFISGVQKDTSLKEISRIQKVNMPPKGKIEMEDKSTNTVENAIETNEWIKKNNVKSIRLVTSNYHIPRSVEEFRALNPKLLIIIHPVYSENVSSQWWKNKGSFCLLASEYNKFLYVYVRNKLKGN